MNTKTPYHIVLLLFVAISFTVASCSNGGDDGAGNGLDLYREFDISVNGVSHLYFSDTNESVVVGDPGSIYINFANYLDPTWPDDRLALILRIDLKRYTNTDTFSDNTTFDMSQDDLFDTLLVTATVLSPRNTRPDNSQRRGYQSVSSTLSAQNQGTVTLHKFMLPSGDPNTDAYRNNIQFDIEIDNVVLNAFTNMSGTGTYSFPVNITVNHARFCNLASGCQNKLQSTSYVGEYTGGPVTVISSNCLSAADDGPFTFSNSSLSITENAWGEFKATATFEDVVSGFNVVSTEDITGTISNTDINGTFVDTFTIDQTFSSSGSGTVSGTISVNSINLSFVGSDTSGDTCSWTADASFTKN